MARITVVCPSCGKKLETPEENIGRDGQCPACENIFDIADSRQAAGAQAAGASGEALPMEYRESGLLSGAVAVAICLVLLMLATFLDWVDPGPAEQFASAQKTAMLVMTGACVLFLALSAALRKSLAPAVLTSGAWGMTAAIWAGGMVRGLRLAVEAASGEEARMPATALEPAGGLYVSIVVALLVIAAAVYAYSRYKEVRALPGMGFFLLGTQVLAVVVGLAVATQHVVPMAKGTSSALTRRAEAPAAGEPGRPGAGEEPGRAPSGPAEPETEHTPLYNELTTAIDQAERSGQSDRVRVLTDLRKEVAAAEQTGQPSDPLDAGRAFLQRLQQRVSEYEYLGQDAKARTARQDLKIAEDFLYDRLRKREVEALVVSLIEEEGYDPSDQGAILGKVVKEFGTDAAPQAIAILREYTSGQR